MTLRGGRVSEVRYEVLHFWHSWEVPLEVERRLLWHGSVWVPVTLLEHPVSLSGKGQERRTQETLATEGQGEGVCVWLSISWDMELRMGKRLDWEHRTSRNSTEGLHLASQPPGWRVAQCISMQWPESQALDSQIYVTVFTWGSAPQIPFALVSGVQYSDISLDTLRLILFQGTS